MNQLTNYEYCQKTTELKASLESGFIVLGERLKKIRDERLYLPVHEAFYAYCEEELKISEPCATKMILVYSRLIEEWGISPEKVVAMGGYNKAYTLSQKSKDKEDFLALMEKCQTADGFVATSEMNKIIADHEGGGVCPHSDTYLVRICKACNLHVKEFENK